MMAGIIGVRNIAAAAGVDPREIVAMLRSGGDMRWLACRAMACLVEERRSDELETAAAEKPKLDMTAFIRAATEIH
jgi:carbamoylphosphate synthase small subunit